MNNKRSLRKERIDRRIKVLSDDIYVLSSTKYMIYLAAPRIIPTAILLISPILAPNIYLLRVITISCIISLLALTFDFLYSTVGLVSLGGALFFGLGAYTSGSLNYYYGVPSAISIPFGALVAAIIATLILIPSLRLRGVYFALVTLILPLLFTRIIEATLILGGTDGLIGLDPIMENVPLKFGTMIETYIIILVMLISLFALRRLYLGTDLGIVMNAIKDNDQAVKASGINITLYKALALFISAIPSTFAGAFIAHLYGWIGLSDWSLDYSILPIASAVVGGMGSLAGSVLGSFILVPLSESLREFSSLRIAIYSLILSLFIVFNPEGIMNWLWRKYHQLERWKEV